MLCWKMTHWWMTKRKLANPGLQLPEMLLQLKVVWPYLSFAFILFSFTNANNVQLNNYLELAESIFDRILSIDRPLFQALGGGSSSSSLLFSVWVLPTITAHSRHEKNCNFWHDHQWHSHAWRICSWLKTFQFNKWFLEWSRLFIYKYFIFVPGTITNYRVSIHKSRLDKVKTEIAEICILVSNNLIFLRYSKHLQFTYHKNHFFFNVIPFFILKFGQVFFWPLCLDF